jgi:hypothetical protein
LRDGGGARPAERFQQVAVAVLQRRVEHAAGREARQPDVRGVRQPTHRDAAVTEQADLVAVVEVRERQLGESVAAAEGGVR